MGGNVHKASDNPVLAADGARDGGYEARHERHFETPSHSNSDTRGRFDGRISIE
jgi:hypothetical protein